MSRRRRPSRAARVGNGLLGVGDAALILLFAAGYAARYLHPSTLWWTQLVALGLPLLAVGVVLATVVVGLMRRRVLFALHLALCALVVARFVPPAWFEREEDGEAMTVMTYNASPSMSPNDDFGVADRVLDIVLERERPHVVALQEVEIQYHRGDRMGLPPVALPLVQRASGWVLPRPPGGPPVGRYRRPVFTRLPTAGVEQPALGTEVDATGLTRSYTRTVVRWQGRRVAVYNVHLWSFTAPRPWGAGGNWGSPATWRRAAALVRLDFLARAAEAARIRAALDGEPFPFVVCGDFNSTPHQWAYAHLAHGLQDAFRQAGRGRGATFPAERPLLRIDFVLASPEWEVASARVLDVPLSDHRPLVAQLVLRGDAGAARSVAEGRAAGPRADRRTPGADVSASGLADGAGRATLRRRPHLRRRRPHTRRGR